MNLLSSIGTNIISSIIYDICKEFIKNGEKPMSEEQILEIIGSFHSDIEYIFERLNQIESDFIYVKKHNEIIFKLLLFIFDDKSDFIISCSEGGYLLDGDYSVNNLDSIIEKAVERYTLSLPSNPPQSLSTAVWPIPHNLKGELLDELKNNLYKDNT